MYIPDIKTWHLPNGLFVVWSPRNQTNSFFVDARVRYGAAYAENPALPHFLEHVVYFSPTKIYNTKKKLYKTLDSLGLISSSEQAETSTYSTRYFGSVAPEDAQKFLSLLVDRLFYSKLSKSTFKHELSRIRDEIQTRVDETSTLFFDVFLPAQAKEKNSILDIPTGSIKQAERVSRAQIKEAYSQYYNPNNVGLFISGPEEMETQIKNTVFTLCSSIKNSRNSRKPNFKSTTLRHGYASHKTKKGLQQHYFAFVFPVTSISFDEEHILTFFYHFLEGHHSFLQKIKDAIGIYDIQSAYFPLPNTALIYIYGSAQNKEDVNKAKDIIETAKISIKKNQFEAVKKHYQQSYLVEFEFDYRTLDLIADYFMKTETILAPEKLFEKARLLDLQKVRQLSNRIFQNKQMNIITLGPTS